MTPYLRLVVQLPDETVELFVRQLEETSCQFRRTWCTTMAEWRSRDGGQVKPLEAGR